MVEFAVVPVMSRRLREKELSPRFVGGLTAVCASAVVFAMALGVRDFYSRHNFWENSGTCTLRTVMPMDVGLSGDISEFERYVRQSGRRDFTIFTDSRSLVAADTEVRWLRRRYPDVDVRRIIEANREELNGVENGDILEDCTTAFNLST